MNKKIYLSELAKLLNIRVKRLELKAQKMELRLSEEGVLLKADAQKLLEAYANSLKSSNTTKARANSLLKGLNTNDLSFKSNPKSPHKNQDEKIPKRTNIRQLKEEVWYKEWVINCTDFCQTLFHPIQHLVQKIIKGSVQILEGLYFKFIALLVAIGVQMHHSANWFYRVSPDENPSWVAALGYAFMVDLFILVVTMEGKLSIAKTFAVLTFLANVLYFQFWVGFDSTVQAYSNAVSSLLISGIMAYIIYAYTELFVKYKSSKNQ